MRTTPLLRRHVEAGIVHFGINHEMRDFVHDRKKNLDIVLCTGSQAPSQPPQTLRSIANDYGILLEARELEELTKLPELRRAPVRPRR